MEVLGLGANPQLADGLDLGQVTFGYHGAGTTDVVDIICHDGLNPDFRNGQAKGPGEYFSPAGSESYSMGSYTGNTDQLIVFAVLGGNGMTQQRYHGNSCKHPAPAYQKVSEWAKYEKYHWSCKGDSVGAPHLVVRNPLHPGPPQQGTRPSPDATFCLPVLVLQWGANAPKFSCPYAPAPPAPAPPLPSASAIFVDPGENVDLFYKVEVFPDKDGGERYEVIESTGPTGTTPFSNDTGVQNTSVINNVPLSTASANMVDRFKNRDKYVKNKTNSGKWHKVPPTALTKQGQPEKVIWQYLDNDKAGPTAPWHNYEVTQGVNSSAVLETLYSQFLALGQNPEVGVRTVQSGQFKYEVNLSANKQKNLETSKVRDVRRHVAP